MPNRVVEITRYLEKKRPQDYAQLLPEVQQEVSDKLFELSGASVTPAARRERTLAFIIKLLEDRQAPAGPYTLPELAQKLYHDLDEDCQSILTGPLHDENVEGIYVKAWNDVRVDYVDGSRGRIEGFLSPGQALDIINTRLLHPYQKGYLDAAHPICEASLGSDIRVEAVCPPVASEAAGVVCYIRRLKNRVLTAEEYRAMGAAGEGELELLQTAARRGVSILIIGRVNSGKTTLMRNILHSLPEDYYKLAIETGAREADQPGVVHLLARESTTSGVRNVTQEMLVEKSLRLNPDFTAVAEMRDLEAAAAVEDSLANNTIISTVHAGSPRKAYRRVAELVRKKFPTENTREGMAKACEAFPLVVFIHRCEDNVRRIMSITDCWADESDTIHYNPLWEYHVEQIRPGKGGGTEVIGEHRQVGNPSENMLAQMRLFGASEDELRRLRKEGA